MIKWKMNDMGNAKNMLAQLYENFKNNFFMSQELMEFNSQETIKIFVIINANLASILLELGNVDKALEHINEAIWFNRNYLNSCLLQELYFIKFNCYYILKNYKNIKKVLHQVFSNCIEEDEGYLEMFKNIIKENMADL